MHSNRRELKYRSKHNVLIQPNNRICCPGERGRTAEGNWAAAPVHSGVGIFCMPCATLKHFATGNGHAQKLEMAQALVSYCPAHYALGPGESVRRADGTLADDNEVDAI